MRRVTQRAQDVRRVWQEACAVRRAPCAVREQWERRSRHGVTLIEVLIAIVIIAVAAIGTLSYFFYGLGGIGRQGNRRAAIERARERLDQLMLAKLDEIHPPDGQVRWLVCNGTPCASWTLSPTRVTQTVPVDDLPAQAIEATIQWVDDPGTPDADPLNPSLDLFELGVKVWFTQSTADTDDNRVFLRTLRAP